MEQNESEYYVVVRMAHRIGTIKAQVRTTKYVKNTGHLQVVTMLIRQGATG